jgi:hypothetical protein
VVNYEPLVRAKQFVRNNKRADGIIAGSTTSITDHVGVTFRQTSELGGIKPCIYAREDRKTACWRHGEIGSVTEPCRIALIR